MLLLTSAILTTIGLGTMLARRLGYDLGSRGSRTGADDDWMFLVTIIFGVITVVLAAAQVVVSLVK
jgi:hypothetical protein